MKFKINDCTYTISNVPGKELIEEYLDNHPGEDPRSVFVFGHTSYKEHTIKINEELHEEEKIKTLKHELCHCWMWNNANHGHEEYNEEHICEIVANSNSFINEIVEKYKKAYIR